MSVFGCSKIYLCLSVQYSGEGYWRGPLFGQSLPQSLDHTIMRLVVSHWVHNLKNSDHSSVFWELQYVKYSNAMTSGSHWYKMFDFSLLLFSQQANNRKISIAPSCGKSIKFEILPIILSDVQIHLMCRPEFFRSDRCVIEKLMHICVNLSDNIRLHSILHIGLRQYLAYLNK